jgi:hypothetical protein
MTQYQSCLEYLLSAQPEIALQLMQSETGPVEKVDLSEVAKLSCDCWWLDGMGFDRSWHDWLEAKFDRRLFLVFEDIQALHGWLVEAASANFICNRKITILCIQGAGKISSADLKQYIWSCPGLDSAYADPRGIFKSFFDYCESLIYIRKAVIREMMKLGAWNWPHIFRRALSIQKDKKISSNHPWRSIPVCIVGAGVSVSENAPLLERLKQRALVLSAGTAINVMEALGCQPHLAMTIDPFRAQYSRFIQVAAIETPLVAGWRSHFQALDCMKGERILFPGAFAYPMTAYWQKKCNYRLEGVEEGLNVVTSALSLAASLDVGEVFLLGVDLCLRQNQMYGAQIAPCEAFYQPPSLEKDTPIVLDQEGNSVTTYAKWLSEAQWISDFASTHNMSVWRNKTHHLMIENTQVIETEDWLQTLVPRDYDGWFWAYLQSLDPVCDQPAKEWLEEASFEAIEIRLWLNERCCDFELKANKLGIDLSQAPAAGLAFEPLPASLEYEFEIFQSELQDKKIYATLIENWDACFRRVYMPSFDLLREGQEELLWIDAWLLVKRLSFLVHGIDTYLKWLEEAMKGQFFSEVDEV